jgi:hypothetical protein
MRMQIELWHCADTRSFRVLWALEELGLPYTLHLLPFPPRARAPEYLQVNPLGTIPAFRNGVSRGDRKHRAVGAQIFGETLAKAE